ncbi:MAG TPA: LytTR family DNA-binding domain-containing protein [Ruminiclostridium sp.]|nr:LytTR family DNA-binding domain-containing protein [Ruminiclostridium sp.]
MKVELKIEAEAIEPYAEIHTAEVTEQINNAVKILSAGQFKPLVGYKDKRAFIMRLPEVLCISCKGQNVAARTEKGEFILKQRIYELEEMLYSKGFLRISSSAIINIDKISNFEMSFNGTMQVQFRDGSYEYASRRYVSKVKKYLGI